MLEGNTSGSTLMSVKKKFMSGFGKHKLFTCEDFLTEVTSIAGVALKQEKIISIVFCVYHRSPQFTVQYCSAQVGTQHCKTD